VFVLGAYPSALHVAWRPPTGKSIRAMAVDNEPVPFWSGDDEDEYIARWKMAVNFRDEEWGQVAGARQYNGSSGRWVDDNVLTPLAARRDEACLTDCLDTYCSSEDGASRIDDTYLTFARRAELPAELRAVRLAAHPSEGAIVEQGVKLHRDRLRRELSNAAPDIVVTLGNAALRVLRAIVGGRDPLVRLKADPTYGTERTLSVNGRNTVWLPLAHPAAPRNYQDAHASWCLNKAK
jgi:uracil DNA glycosylase superfamily protein